MYSVGRKRYKEKRLKSKNDGRPYCRVNVFNRRRGFACILRLAQTDGRICATIRKKFCKRSMTRRAFFSRKTPNSSVVPCGLIGFCTLARRVSGRLSQVVENNRIKFKTFCPLLCTTAAISATMVWINCARALCAFCALKIS